jgi:leucine dehydrogenase
MAELRELGPFAGHEVVLEYRDESALYRGIIAIHSTARGPAVGGTRFLTYPTFDEAVADALRLSQAMTRKAALAGLDFGGGKAVVLAGGQQERERLFQAHGDFIERLGGAFITGEDVGTSPSDMAFVKTRTRWVAGLTDPSPWTAEGVLIALRAAAEVSGYPGMAGMTVALQGCGNVGYSLAGKLHQAGATLIVTDVDPSRTARAAREFGARVVEPEAIYAVDADVFAPCALGGVLHETTIRQLRCRLVVGAANNQLATPEAGALLEARGILLVPDFVANAGGVIFGTQEVLGWSVEQARTALEGIYTTTTRVLRHARDHGIPPSTAADQLALLAVPVSTRRPFLLDTASSS